MQTATLQLAGVVWVPVLAFLFLDPATGVEYRNCSRPSSYFQLVPLTVGLVGQRTKWMGSPVTTRAVGAISNASFAVLVALILIHDLPRVVQILDIRVLTAVVGLIVASLGMVSAARKGGLALVIATNTFGGDAEAVIVIVAYALIELVLLTTVAIWWRTSGSRVTPKPRFSGG